MHGFVHQCQSVNSSSLLFCSKIGFCLIIVRVESFPSQTNGTNGMSSKLQANKYSLFALTS